MSQQTLPCTPPPPKKTAEGEFIFFVQVSSVPKKNVFKEKHILFGDIQVKRPKSVVLRICSLKPYFDKLNII